MMSGIAYLLIGLVSGVIAGMGMGGGSLLIPALTLLCAVDQHAAQGINMLSFIPAALIALWIHKKRGRVDIKRCIPLILTGTAGTVLGSLCAGRIEGEWLRRGFGGFLILLSVFQFISGERDHNKK